MSTLSALNVTSICHGLRQTGGREVVADALAEVAAIPCSPEGLELRIAVAEAGGLESIMDTLLASHGDVRLQCKAANALGSLCMSEEIARGFSRTPNSSAVLDRLGDMLRSRSQWAQADAAGCLGWLVDNLSAAIFHELLMLVAQLMVKHIMTDDEVFIQQERHREDRATWGRDRGDMKNSKSDGGGGGGNKSSRGGWRGQLIDNKRRVQEYDERKEGVVRERMDNIRVYSLVFLLKASHAEPSTMPAMVEVGTIPALLKHLASKPFSPPSDKCPRGKGDAFVRRQAGGVEQEESGESPSFLLAARLLYAFSSDPDGRALLLRTRCLPPLIRIRKQFQQLSTASGIEPPTIRHQSSRLPASDSEGSSSALGNELPLDGGGMAHKLALGQDSGETARESIGDKGSSTIGSNAALHRDMQPPLEAILTLIIDQLVGRGLP